MFSAVTSPRQRPRLTAKLQGRQAETDELRCQNNRVIGLLNSDNGSGGFISIREPFVHQTSATFSCFGEFLTNNDAQCLMTTPSRATRTRICSGRSQY
jgi:hypothetical protein